MKKIALVLIFLICLPINILCAEPVGQAASGTTENTKIVAAAAAGAAAGAALGPVGVLIGGAVGTCIAIGIGYSLNSLIGGISSFLGITGEGKSIKPVGEDFSNPEEVFVKYEGININQLMSKEDLEKLKKSVEDQKKNLKQHFQKD